MKLKKKVRNRKRLQAAILYAQKIEQGVIRIKSVDCVREINEDIKKYLKENRNKIVNKEKPRTYIKDIRNSFKKYLKLKKIGRIDKRFEFIDEVLDIVKATEDRDSFNVSAQFARILENFQDVPDRICRFLLKIGVEFDSKFGKVSSVVEDFQILRKKLRIEENIDLEMASVKNPQLRKHVCRKFAKFIEKSGLPRRESQIQALNLEESIRTTHHSMGEDYLRRCRVTLRSLKEHIQAT
jgi:uncharacterized protein YlbG (UPF0298 family)